MDKKLFGIGNTNIISLEIWVGLGTKFDAALSFGLITEGGRSNDQIINILLL